MNELLEAELTQLLDLAGELVADNLSDKEYATKKHTKCSGIY